MFLSGLCRLQTQYMNEMLFLSPSLSELWDKRDQRGLKAWAEGNRPLTVTLGSRKNQQFQPLGMCSSGDPTAPCFTWFPQISRNPGDGEAHLASDQDLMGPLPLALQASPWGQSTMGCHLRKRSWRRSPGFPTVHWRCGSGHLVWKVLGSSLFPPGDQII